MNDPFVVAALLAAWVAGVAAGYRLGWRRRHIDLEEHHWSTIAGTIRLTDWWWPPDPYDWANDPAVAGHEPAHRHTAS